MHKAFTRDLTMWFNDFQMWPNIAIYTSYVIVKKRKLQTLMVQINTRLLTQENIYHQDFPTAKSSTVSFNFIRGGRWLVTPVAPFTHQTTAVMFLLECNHKKAVWTFGNCNPHHFWDLTEFTELYNEPCTGKKDYNNCWNIDFFLMGSPFSQTWKKNFEILWPSQF